ncbi:hypothetical protein VNO80_26134 [Phaseolus coccineus]|uniref:Uncharacterized protein n=1 Tax=Phaseolus coccineus TaxID=3886 RepID=A0AAN9LW33_PHACN
MSESSPTLPVTGLALPSPRLTLSHPRFPSHLPSRFPESPLQRLHLDLHLASRHFFILRSFSLRIFSFFRFLNFILTLIEGM